MSAALNTDIPHRPVYARTDSPVQMADPGAFQVPASAAKGMLWKYKEGAVLTRFRCCSLVQTAKRCASSSSLSYLSYQRSCVTFAIAPIRAWITTLRM